jgi:predicted dehydrogenase
VTAVCDVDEEVAARAAEPHGANVYGDHRELFADEELDALFVGLPPFVHTEQELMAAERGIHLFVEKPVALSLAKAREIEAAIDDAGVIAQVGYQRRYADALREAAAILDGRTVGMLDGFWKGGVPGTRWWREKDKSGGQVVEQATHIYDVVRYLGGEIETVSAYGANRIVDAVDFEDVVTASMRHEGGVVSHVGSSSAASDGGHGIEVIAEDAHLHLRGNSFTGRVDGETVEYEGENDPSVEQVESFVEAVETGDGSDVAAPYADAVKTLALTLAVEESMERGKPVVPEA